MRFEITDRIFKFERSLGIYNDMDMIGHNDIAPNLQAFVLATVFPTV